MIVLEKDSYSRFWTLNGNHPKSQPQQLRERSTQAEPEQCTVGTSSCASSPRTMQRKGTPLTVDASPQPTVLSQLQQAMRVVIEPTRCAGMMSE
eukprot:COSAG02_NODE_4915_length_4837_cov_6.226467_5_plen_94_part_00